MINHAIKITVICSLLFISTYTLAEGLVDIKPYVNASINYDDNLFRFSSSEQAKATFGSSNTSDVVKRVDLGVVVNLRLSRQLVTLSSSINESRYDRFDILNNTGKSNKLNWSWRLGNDLYGEVSASENEAISGFNEINKRVKNLRTTSRQLANINWNLQPSWTLSATREYGKSENELSSLNALNREDDIYEAGIRYQNQRGTQLGVAYRVSDSTFPNRSGFEQVFYGDESSKKEIVVNAVWLPSAKTRVSTRLSNVNLDIKNLPQRNFNGISQRWSLDHSFTSKANVNLTAYQDIAPVDDIISTYVKVTGFSVNPSWILTDKIAVQAGLGYEERNYLGSAGILLSSVEFDRYDESKLARVSLTYTPTMKSLVALQYQGEKRESNASNANYQYNNINFSMRYDF
ncbi:XrtB/PEP-CTERM-associated polysaccharide biosynthesis outer membrane protein EpsL [Methylotenera sp.]|uniref:XrtB/PEP-CTERM-associated polysaccharide biosynthesis outer membrane protein EpsL n=1 Tax=Methylotenera sp. TaxID=2051956 RepID=UPI0027242CA2|nr:XrtB/PEP-CTERM-associated polysaccharide biosynthesis outer membrane protein EpsL [Methylotenera sp.]MDO9204582.1 hypothetical protein [Methylotenera sp.]MDP2071288.1 hypothetical protein [Methylotenera sp.]MDP3005205.1 hypothetical protein [Methylotenera sp.]MDP3818107.1 hypothetical protein [Methylotenera sp.]